MRYALDRDAVLAARTSVNIAGNAVNLAQGTKIIIQSGHVLTITAKGVEVSDEDHICDYEAYLEAQGMAAALEYLLWGDSIDGVGNVAEADAFPHGCYAQNLIKVMRCFGIDASKPFRVNGIQYNECQ